MLPRKAGASKRRWGGSTQCSRDPQSFWTMDALLYAEVLRGGEHNLPRHYTVASWMSSLGSGGDRCCCCRFAAPTGFRHLRRVCCFIITASETVRSFVMDEEGFVSALYRAALLREPDPEGLKTHVAALKSGKSPEDILGRFIRSAEFGSKIDRLAMRYPLDGAPPMSVDLELSADQHERLWAHVARAWTSLGSSEPYWSVLTGPRWKVREMTRADALNAFYDTGTTECGTTGQVAGT